MRAASAAIAFATVLVGLAGCTGDSDEPSLLCPAGSTYVELRTSLGTLLIEMLPASAPHAVDWFLDLVDRGFYEDAAFHHITSQGNGYMLGGDHGSDGSNRTVPVSPPAREISEAAKPDRIGRVLLGAEGRFFILFGPAPHYEGDHSVFGQVVEGIDILAGMHSSIATATGTPYHPVVMDGLRIGCSDIIPRVRANLVTPLVWSVRADTDHALVWAHNGVGAAHGAPLAITMRNGTAVPDDWEVSFGVPAFLLARAGSRVQTSHGYEYPDWAWTLATLTVPADEPSHVHEMTLHVGDAEQPFLLIVHADRTTVSAVGDEVLIQYAGRFADTLRPFDDGTFRTTIGSGDTVPGFDGGLAGLAVGERAILHLPPALAYGFDVPAGDPLEEFDGRSLDFSVLVGEIKTP